MGALGASLGSPSVFALDANAGKTFAGDVRLTLPPIVYATPGVEANVYFDNVVLVVNPANYVFDITCDPVHRTVER